MDVIVCQRQQRLIFFFQFNSICNETAIQSLLVNHRRWTSTNNRKGDTKKRFEGGGLPTDYNGFYFILFFESFVRLFDFSNKGVERQKKKKDVTFPDGLMDFFILFILSS